MLDTGSLTFLWPSMLWLLLAVPLAAALYWVLAARRSKSSVQYASLETVGGHTTKTASSMRRMMPLLLWTLALTALILAIARPQAALTLPARLDAIVLALDMSNSMRATDVKPNRLSAARDAAKTFIEAQPRNVRIGVVAVAASAAVVQSPTNNREDIVASIDRLETQRGTALGSGLIIALDAVLPTARIDVEEFINPRAGEKKIRRTDEMPARVAKGDNKQVAIVLLSDGQSNVGPDPVKAAEIASDYGVRIYTVGIGTTEGTTVSAEGWNMRVRLDEEALKKIAAVTDAEYFQASDAATLKKIYQALSTKLSFERQQPTEITAVVAGIGAALAMFAAFLSMWWYSRIL
ncbi:MAG TPA: VWA domain-containing protein [Burkholderiaceae bacterium]|nr:VWA domain-containing protein [Burkholderiaceae bacterium]